MGVKDTIRKYAPKSATDMLKAAALGPLGYLAHEAYVGDEPTRPDSAQRLDDLSREAASARYDARRFAPKVGIRDTGDITVPDLEAVGPGTAHSAGEVERVTAPKLGDVERIRARDIGAARTVDAVDLGGAERAEVAPVGRTSIAGGEAMALTRAAARGEGPSKAVEMLRGAQDKAIQQRLGVVARARGADRAGARRELMLAAGQEAADLGAKAAEIRAGEMAASRAELGALETTEARLTQEANQLEAQIKAQLAAGNRDGANALRIRQGELIQQARQHGADAANRRAEFGATQDLAAQEFGATAANRREEFGAGLEMDAAKFGADAANRRADLEAGRRTEVEQKALEREAARRAQLAKMGLDAQQIEAQLKLDRDKAAADQELTVRRIQQEGDIEGLKVQSDAISTGERLKTDQYKTDAEVRQNKEGSFIKGFTDAVGAVSDERVKSDVRPTGQKVGAGAAERVSRAMKAVSYRIGDGPREVGVLAQDAQKNPETSGAVHDRDGVLHVDYKRLAANLLAVLQSARKKRRA